MAAAGIVAAGAALITTLQWIGYLGAFGFNSTMFLVAVIGALVMAWAGWQELQAEGGTWQFGTAGAPASTAARNERVSTPAEPAEPIAGDEPAGPEERRTEA
jgi:threonine/homoserine/homoserine lactone efflux protein